ncbi:rhodanese-like domain-containing protein [Sphingomonas asaccharolytica]|uniref:rhodanese-like domain-containing protein n=1 Tax=Sphingomonas asaccharolytica TaxID=40681 RepID=UPI00082D7683|nr:rhodanese-like domain-containing protein [Sphingomonas asaccharolytica]
MTPLLLAAFLMAVDGPPPVNPQIDYQGFQRLAARVSPERAKRRVTLARFKQMAATAEAIILDARSADAFAQGHIAGAINLPLTDFTAPALAAVLPDRNRPVLIYCNNNFSNDRPPVMLKSAAVSLNIQTYINLAAYGYRAVYELGETIDLDDPKVGWVKG